MGVGGGVAVAVAVAAAVSVGLWPSGDEGVGSWTVATVVVRGTGDGTGVGVGVSAVEALVVGCWFAGCDAANEPCRLVPAPGLVSVSGAEVTGAAVGSGGVTGLEPVEGS